MRTGAVGVGVAMVTWWAIAALGGIDRVYACTAPAGGLPEFTVADRVEDASVVIRGTVVEVDESNFLQRATIVVHEYYKGSGTALVLIEGFGPSSLCKSDVEVGDTLVFYASGAPGELQANYLTQFDATAPPDDETRAQIVAATGEPATLPDAGTRLVAPGAARDAQLPASAMVRDAASAGRSSWSVVGGVFATASIATLGVVVAGKHQRRVED